MKRKFTIGIITATMFTLTACSIPSNQPVNQTPASQTTTQQTTVTEQKKKLTSYTLSDIAAHASKDDCWIAIDGKVYDVTMSLPRHPGGEAILQGCGKDATALFANRNGEGESHSANAYAGLENFLIGELR